MGCTGSRRHGHAGARKKKLRKSANRSRRLSHSKITMSLARLPSTLYTAARRLFSHSLGPITVMMLSKGSAKDFAWGCMQDVYALLKLVAPVPWWDLKLVLNFSVLNWRFWLFFGIDCGQVSQRESSARHSTCARLSQSFHSRVLCRSRAAPSARELGVQMCMTPLHVARI